MKRFFKKAFLLSFFLLGISTTSMAQKDCRTCGDHYTLTLPTPPFCWQGEFVFEVNNHLNANLFSVEVLFNNNPYQAGITEWDPLSFSTDYVGNYTVIVKCYQTPQINGSTPKTNIPPGSTLIGTCIHTFYVNSLVYPINATHEVNGIQSDNSYYLGLSRCELEELKSLWLTSPPFQCGHASTQHRYSLYRLPAFIGDVGVVLESKPFIAGCPSTSEVSLDFFDIGEELEVGDYFQIRLEIEYQGCLSYRGVRFRYLGEDGKSGLRLGMARKWVNSLDGPSGIPPLPYVPPVSAVNLFHVPSQLNTFEDNPNFLPHELGSQNQYLIIHNTLEKKPPMASPFVWYYETMKHNISEIKITLEGDKAGPILEKTIVPAGGTYNFWQHNFADFEYPVTNFPGTGTNDYFNRAWSRGEFFEEQELDYDKYCAQNNVYTAKVVIHVTCESGGIDILTGSVDFIIVDGNYRPVLDENLVIDEVVNIRSSISEGNLVQIFDMNGRHITSVQNNTDWRTNLSGNVPSGIYIYRIIDGSELKVSKIFIP